MMRRGAAALMLALLSACTGKPAAPAATNPSKPANAGRPAHDAMERGNLFNFALGASVVSRTSELTLDQSALRAVDGDPESAWNSPPDDGKQQTIVFSLPARTLVDKVGLRTPKADVFRITVAQVDSSIDGVTFTPLATMKLAATDDVQLFPVAPTSLVYLRLTTLGVAGRFARLQSMQARGTAQETVKQQPIGGCWTINGLEASFVVDRGHVTGAIGGDNPISFDGGGDGQVFRFVWVSGPNWGFGAITTAPDGKHLSGLRWFQEPIAYDAAESWFGDRNKCAGQTKTQDVPNLFMHRAGRYPLFGLRFDTSGALVESDSAATLDWLAAFAGQHASQQLRLLSREYRQENEAANKARAQTRLDSLRAAMQKRGIDTAKFDFVALGADTPRNPIENEIMRVLYGAIELQSP